MASPNTAHDTEEQLLLAGLVGKTHNVANGRTNLLLQHMLDAAAVAELLWDHLLAPATRRSLDEVAGGPGRGRTLLAWLCGLHDAGKATPAHQNKSKGELVELRTAAGLVCLPTNPRHTYHHTRAGAAIVKRLLSAAGWSSRQIGWIWPVVAGHHGTVPGAEATRSPTASLKRLSGDHVWERAQELLTTRLTREVTGGGLPDLEPRRMPSLALQVQLSGLVMLADWTASDTCLTGVDDIRDAGYEQAHERAAWVWGKSGIRTGWDALPLPAPEAFRERFGKPPRRVQRLAMDTAAGIAEPGLIFIEAPPREGATRAALMAVEILAARFGMNGVFVGVPQWSLADGTFDAVRSWLTALDPAFGRQAILLNSNRDLTRARADARSDGSVATTESDEVDRFLARGNRGLLCPFVVGPIEEMLRAAVRVPVAVARMAGLLGKVVVIDGMRALDARTAVLLEEVLHWLGRAGVPVVLTSTGLPSERRAALGAAHLAGAAAADADQRDYGAALPPGTAYGAATPPGPLPQSESETQPDDEPTAASVTAYWPTAGGADGITWRRRATRPRRTFTVTVCPDSPPLEAPAAPAQEPGPLTLLLRRELGADGGAVVVLDGVARAQAAARELAHHCDVLLLHEGLVERERVVRARRAPSGTRRRPFVAITTPDLVAQLPPVEGHLLIADAAPLDLLASWAGRLDPPAASAARIVVTAVGLLPETDSGPPVFLPDAVRRYGRHLLLKATADLLADASEGQTWVLPDDAAQLIARGYGDESEDIPPAWQQQAHSAWAEDRQRHEEHTDLARRFALSQQGYAPATTAGLHRLSASYGPRDADLLALVQAGQARAEVIVLLRDGDTHRTTGGCVVPKAGAAQEGFRADRLLTETLYVPAHWEDLTSLKALGLTGADDARLNRMTVLELGATGPVAVDGHRLCYQSELGLLDLGPGTREEAIRCNMTDHQ